MTGVFKKLRTATVEQYLAQLVPSPAPNPEWEIDPDRLKEVRIRWPAVYQWHGAGDWVDVLKMSLRRHVTVEVVDNIPQLYKGTVVFEVVRGTKVQTVAIGYSDYLPIDDDCADHCDLYFKMQFKKGGYGRQNVIPGGYVPDGKRLYFHLESLRGLRDMHDYRFDVNGRFSLNYAPEIRKHAIGLLSDQDKFDFEGGLKTVTYHNFLKEVARSKICVDLPGLGPLCFRLMNYLAIGTCVVAYPHESILHVPLIDREHIVYCKPDLSDLIDLCEHYLTHVEERERIARNARKYFDQNLHKDNLVRYYLHHILRATG